MLLRFFEFNRNKPLVYPQKVVANWWFIEIPEKKNLFAKRLQIIELLTKKKKTNKQKEKGNREQKSITHIYLHLIELCKFAHVAEEQQEGDEQEDKFRWILETKCEKKILRDRKGFYFV